ncbi:MAG: HDOD domain-containing protein [Leptospirales bacterium]|nr:HDOD domain-containing protein [Leptospirales bacterium]
MSGTQDKNYNINTPDYKAAISEGKDFFVQFNLFTPDVEAVLIRILHHYLEKFDIIYVKDTIITMLKELVNNSIKANLKRLFFKTKGFDINKTDEYRLGMESFKSEIYSSESEDYFAKAAASNLIVRVAFKSTQTMLYISIINNTPILDNELKKVQSRVSKAYKYTDISEAFDDVLDDSEGAGLGLIMGLMLFKNSGFPAESFKIYKKDNLTIATISVPQKMTKTGSSKQIADEVMKEMNNIPALPESITEIQTLCKDPDVSVKTVAAAISRDPGLAASLLKVANSAGYMGNKKVTSIEEATVKIGFKELNIMLIASGVDQIVSSKYKRFEPIWQESYKRSSYARAIATKLKKQELSDLAYLGSLLVDIGKIILLSLDNDVMERLKKIAGFKGIESTDLLEEMSLGVSHATLGGMVCQNWHFSESLTTTIEFHHRPYMAPDSLKELVYVVYLADIFVEIENRRTHFEFADEDVLEFFKLSNKDDFEKMHEELKDYYSTLNDGKEHQKEHK